MALPILTFHAIDERPSIISLSPSVFVRAIERLREGGARFLRLGDALALLREARPFPPGSIVLTFDDGYHSVYEVAFPVLQRYGVPATVFLAVGRDPASTGLPSLEGRAMLHWHEIREMERHGIDFGAHSCSHADLTRMPDERLEAEVRDSKAIIEQALGRPVPSFAYPYGRYDQRVRAVVERHFDSACSDRLGFVTARSDPYGLERVDTYYVRSGRLLGLLNTSLFPWYVRARAIPRNLRRFALRLAGPARSGSG